MVGGYLSLLYSISDKPLEYWSKHQSQTGRIRKILDSDLLENVIEIQDFEQPNGFGTSILCPFDSSQFLNIELPVLVVVIKNLNLQCRLRVQVVDTQNCLHHFQFSNADLERRNFKDVICRVKVKLESGWNKLELNLSHLTQVAFKRTYASTQRIEICGNCRLRRVYFIDKHYENHEICPKLLHGFLDAYMLKWGIHVVDRSTQTNSRKSKSKIRDHNDPKGLSKHFSTTSLGENETNNTSKNSVARKDRSKKIDENFLRELQLKSEILINDFFDRQCTKFPCALEFKRQAKIKPYAFPTYNANRQKNFSPGIISEDALKKINILCTFTNTDMSTEQKRKNEKIIKNMEENWARRYYSSQEKSLSNYDASRRHVSSSLGNSMLVRKPKSLLILSDIKACSGKEKIGETTKKPIITIKRNEGNSIVA